jgi:hypothetical protein
VCVCIYIYIYRMHQCFLVSICDVVKVAIVHWKILAKFGCDVVKVTIVRRKI